MNTSQVIRDAMAQRSVLFRYAVAHERFAEQEQRCLARGRPHEAADAHRLALLILRAYQLELDDPVPEGLER